MIHKLPVTVCLLLWTSAAASAADFHVEESAARIAAGIRQAGMKRVAVLPMLLERDDTKFSPNGTSPELTASLHARLYSEQMQTSLADMSGDSYRLVDSEEVMSALKEKFTDLRTFRGTSSELKPVGDAVKGGLQGLVIGTLRDRPLEPEQYSPFSARDVTWKLMDLADGTIAAARGQTGNYSLADEVYAGRSQEFFRWKNARLWAIGFGWGFPGASKISLNPRDALELFHLERDQSEQPHPIFNPHCPYKVKFTVEGRERSLMIPVDREARRIGFPTFNDETRPDDLFGQDFGGHSGAGSHSAYLPLHPGEGLKIHVRNDSPQPVMVAVFVDGVNVLGKKRELPDDKCRVWRFDSQKAGVFSGWYSGETGKEQVEPFVITPWEDSVAAKLGQTERTGTITLVFFTEGWPDRQQILSYPRTYGIFACWDSAQQKVLFKEQVEPPLPPGIATAGTPDSFAMGGKAPQANPLHYQKSHPQGTILAAMTVSYGTKADIPEVELERQQKGPAAYRLANSKNRDLPYVFVEAPTNGLLPHQDAIITDSGTQPVRGQSGRRSINKSDRVSQQAAQALGGQAANRTRFGAYVKTSRSGVQVAGVMPNSPATRCQNGDGKNWVLESGDIITHVNGQPVRNEDEYRAGIQASPTSMRITVIGRDRQTYEFSVQLND